MASTTDSPTRKLRLKQSCRINNSTSPPAADSRTSSCTAKKHNVGMEPVMVNSGPTRCQICARSTHLAIRCPFIHARCRVPSCTGVMMLYVSTSDRNPNRPYLKCHFLSCGGFRWLDEAILESGGNEASSSVQHQRCFQCGELTHWKKDCPRNYVRCKTLGCNAKTQVKRCSEGINEGRKFLKCGECASFQWLDTPQSDPTTEGCVGPVEARIKVELGLNEFCEVFGRKISFNSN